MPKDRQHIQEMDYAPNSFGRRNPGTSFPTQSWLTRQPYSSRYREGKHTHRLVDRCTRRRARDPARRPIPFLKRFTM